MRQLVALFGAAEKGVFQKPYLLSKLPQLFDYLGNPPKESEGLSFAIQAILYNREVLFFRVEEEGFSEKDYLHGLKYLGNKEYVQKVHALCLPGVGDPEILAASHLVCDIHKSFLIATQKDLYDFLTSTPS